jgi:hypothetical protein
MMRVRELTVFTRRYSSFARLLGALLLAVAASMVVPAAPASAQGFFDALFGAPRRPYAPPSASAYADPQPRFNLFGSRPAEPPARRSESGPSAGGVAYCVRLCDGRHFPIQRSSGANAAQVCNSFCPATRTKIFSGGVIDRAVASDGTRYSDLPNAFVYRERFVADCTCNGKDPVGLVTAAASDDPTLRNGDIVANESGLVAYTGGRRQNAEFTPVDSYSPFGAEMRNRLAGIKIVPNNATPVPADLIAGPSAGDRRVQLER